VGGDSQATTYREGDDRYDVQLRVKKEFRDSRQALDRLYVPSAALGNVAVSSVVNIQESTGPTQIERYNRQRQVFLFANIDVAHGQSLSNVLQILERTVQEMNLPPDYRTGLVGRSKEFARSARSYVFALLLSIVLMYMVLAAQFESFIDPLVILVSVPLAVFGAFACLVLLNMGADLHLWNATGSWNIYTQIGVVTLVGLISKHGILIVEFANQLQQRGRSKAQAALESASLRLRPILMTTGAMVLGSIPLALAAGAGAEARHQIGWVIVGGMSFGTLLTLFVVPVVYVLLARTHEAIPLGEEEKTDLQPL